MYGKERLVPKRQNPEIMSEMEAVILFLIHKRKEAIYLTKALSNAYSHIVHQDAIQGTRLRG